MAQKSGTRQTAPKPKGEPDVAINVPIPADLHRALRVRAIEEGVHMKDAVVLAITEWVG